MLEPRGWCLWRNGRNRRNRRNRLYQYLGVVLAGAFLLSCTMGPPITGDGLPAQRSKQIAVFSQLELNLANAEIRLVPGEVPRVTLIGEEALIERIRLRYRDQKLTVDTTYRLKPQIPLQIVLQAPDLQQLLIRGNSRVIATEPVVSEFLDIEIEGTSIVDLNVVAQQLRVRGSGTSYSLWRGTVEEVDLTLTGAAEAAASQLMVAKARVSLSGTAQAQLWVSETVDAATSGSSQLQLSGTAKIQHYTSSGDSKLSLQR